MSVRAIWKIKRIQSLNLPEKYKHNLIDAVVSKKQRMIMLYAWKDKANTPHIFLTKAQAVTDWITNNSIQALKDTKGIPLFTWSEDVKNVINFVTKGSIKNMTLPDKVVTHIVPSTLFDAISKARIQIKR